MKYGFKFGVGGVLPDAKRQEILDWAKGKDYGKIEKETALLPYIIAEGIADKIIIEKYKSELDKWKDLSKEEQTALDNKIKKESIELQDYMVGRAEILFKQAKEFKKKIKGSGNKGRDYLNAFMEHWAEAYEKNKAA
jgi:5-hydroxyisourate hydrolase-like protein (transthyretin family)